MNKKLNVIILAAALACVLLIAGMAYKYLAGNAGGGLTVVKPTEDLSPTEETEDKNQASLAPDFTVYDLDGNPHKLSDFRGKPVVLNFWASWCGPCKSEMPDFDQAYAQYGEDIHFLMVNLTDGYQETVESASSFIGEMGYTFPVYYDRDMDGTAAYGVSSVPVTYFIDAQGYLVAYGRGALTASALNEGIGMITE